MILLAVATLSAAQESYVIDSVCVGADRYYRVDGEKGSTWEWMISDTLGNEISTPAHTLFEEEDPDTPGDSIFGSEVNITWNQPGEFILSTIQYSIHNCDTTEQGIIKVYEAPDLFAGDDQIVCTNQRVQLVEATADNYSSLLWETRGDGVFDDETALQPTYTHGSNDSIAGSVTLILTANGLAENSTCTPVKDSLEIMFSNPKVTLAATDPLCFDDSSGTITAVASNGFEPYAFNWTGPDTFTADTPEISGLESGWYYLTVTDSIGCMAEDSMPQ